MNRLFWAVTFLILASAGWAQSTWRGQAEVWPVASAPLEGYVAASNQFPRNSLLTVENYRTKKTIQVRVVAALPAGSSALVLLNAKAAQALDIKAGDVPLVGVRLDPTGVERADNPDPDVNPLALKPADPAPAEVAEAPVEPTPAVVPGSAEVAAAPAPLPAAPVPTSLPLPALAVANEPEATPATPGRRVFATTKEPEPQTTEPEPEPAVPLPTPSAVAVAPETRAPSTPVPTAPPVAESPAPAAPAPAPAASAPVPNPATAPAAPAPSAPTVAPAPALAAPVPVVPPAVAAAPVPASPLGTKPAPASAWVSTPGKIEGPVLGQVAVLASLEKGRSYVQVGAWGSEVDALKALESVKSYVPLALFKAEGEKSPWRLVAASAPKAQLGVLVMHYRSQGYRTAAVVKG